MTAIQEISYCDDWIEATNSYQAPPRSRYTHASMAILCKQPLATRRQLTALTTAITSQEFVARKRKCSVIELMGSAFCGLSECDCFRIDALSFMRVSGYDVFAGDNRTISMQQFLPGITLGENRTLDAVSLFAYTRTEDNVLNRPATNLLIRIVHSDIYELDPCAPSKVTTTCFATPNPCKKRL